MGHEDIVHGRTRQLQLRHAIGFRHDARRGQHLWRREGFAARMNHAAARTSYS